MENTLVIKTVKDKSIATFLAITVAVVMPILFHIAGKTLHIGASLGEIFLPMHFSIMLVGFLAGSIPGLIAGFLSPIISYSLTGMPNTTMLFYISLECAVYGLASGYLSNKKLNCILKVLLVQISARAVRSLAIIIGHYAFSSKVPLSVIYTSILVGWVGIILQLAVISYILYYISKKIND